MTGPGIIVSTPSAAEVMPLGKAGSQQVLLGGSRGDASPMLLGVSHVLAGRRSDLIVHTTAEIAYVVQGSGAMVTDRGMHPFEAGDAILIEAGCWHAIQAGDAGAVMAYAFPQPDVPPTRRWGEHD